MLAASPGPRVPPEFIGRARVLRDRLALPAATWAAGSRELLRPFAGPKNTNYLRRRTLLARLPDDWRRLPALGCLDLRFTTRARVLDIIETRAIPYRVHTEGWHDDELAIALLRRHVRVRGDRRPPAVDQASRIFAVIGMHALARRYARGFDCADASVLRDLGALAERASWRTGIRGRAAELDVPVADGCWRGSAAKLDGLPVLSIRTYVE
jgi:hypothetical protein